MYKILKSLYYLTPFKYSIFLFIKKVCSPSTRIAGYLKFKGVFSFPVTESKSLKVFNDNSTVPTLLFWKGEQGYENQSISLWKELCKNANRILDVGANFGLYGLIAQKINTNSDVIYFEPLKRNSERIKKNLEINNFCAKIEQVAVSNFNGTATFYDMASEENTIGSFSREFVEAHSHHKAIVPIKVGVVTLDSYFDKSKVSSLDLVKIDVEGAEFEVIEGFRNSVIRFKPDFLVEITSEVNSKKIGSLFAELNLGYEYFEINEKEGLIKRRNISKLGNRNYFICKPETCLYFQQNFRIRKESC